MTENETVGKRFQHLGECADRAILREFENSNTFRFAFLNLLNFLENQTRGGARPEIELRRNESYEKKTVR